MTADASLRCGGVLASFASEDELLAAIGRLQEGGVRNFETYTPHEVHTDGSSWIPLVIAAAGIGGAVAGFLMQAYAAAISYPVNIGGRPLLSWPAFVPIAFEIGVLCAIAGGFFAFLVANRLPTLWAPIDEAEQFSEATRASYFLSVRSDDDVARDRARRLLAEHGAPFITDLPVAAE
jgi:Protein of unknown function (DUF3341)